MICERVLYLTLDSCEWFDPELALYLRQYLYLTTQCLPASGVCLHAQTHNKYTGIKEFTSLTCANKHMRSTVSSKML